MSLQTKKEQGRSFTILVIIAVILGSIDLLILSGNLYTDPGLITYNIGSIIGFSITVLALYKITKFIISRNKGFNERCSKNEIYVISLSNALLIYFLLGIISGSVAENFNDLKNATREGFKNGYSQTTTEVSK